MMRFLVVAMVGIFFWMGFHVVSHLLSTNYGSQ